MVGFKTDVGNFRKLNEDNLGVYESDIYSLYIIADGMGGHNAGEVASKTAVDLILEYAKNYFDSDDVVNFIRKAVNHANEKVFMLQKDNDSLSGMGTTINLCLVCKGVNYIANIGDSSCFMINSNGITKITKDHSLVQQLIDNGSITEEEAKTHPNKNIITRALGTASKVEVDIFEIDITSDAKFVLCTDGLSNEVSNNEIYDIVTKNSEQDACEKLVELSKLKGGKDNISVIVFEGECKDDWNYTK